MQGLQAVEESEAKEKRHLVVPMRRTEHAAMQQVKVVRKRSELGTETEQCGRRRCQEFGSFYSVDAWGWWSLGVGSAGWKASPKLEAPGRGRFEA